MWAFGDSFDLYATFGDAGAGYWDTANTSQGGLAAGRFAGGQAVNLNSASAFVVLAKASGANDAIHHIVCAVKQTMTLSGSNLSTYWQLSDGATNQVCIVFRSDGAILLTSGTPGGTVLTTYTGAITAANTWFAFEFEVIISPTVGRFRARKNGNTVDDFDSTATLNTRLGANSYANKLTLGNNAISGHLFDDLLWRSDPTSVPWVGDIRCYVRMPASDASIQFSRSPAAATAGPTGGSTAARVANTAVYQAFTASVTGTIGSATILVAAGGTGHLKAAIYSGTVATAPGTLLLASSEVTNPAAGSVTVTFSPPVAVTKGTTYVFGINQDTSLTYTSGSNSATTGSAITYASWPASNPASLTGAQFLNVFTVNITTTINSELVNETLQDSYATYVYDSNVNDADFYNIAALAATPASVVGVTTRGFCAKSDAGTRNMAVQLKSGGTTVQTPAPALSSSLGWLFRTDLTDPATGAAWTPAAVNGVQIGPKVTV